MFWLVSDVLACFRCFGLCPMFWLVFDVLACVRCFGRCSCFDWCSMFWSVFDVLAGVRLDFSHATDFGGSEHSEEKAYEVYILSGLSWSNVSIGTGAASYKWVCPGESDF